MLEKTPLTFLAVKKDDYLNVTVSGFYSLSEVKKLFTELLEKVVSKNLTKLFVNVCQVQGKITILERFYFGEFAALEAIRFKGLGLNKISIAFYGIEPIIDPDKFGEIVAKNRGLNVIVTTEIEEATQFLHAN
jgi:hypothetical protein